MRFDSIIFFLFLPLALGGYFALRGRVKLRNGWLLACSYLFYGWWDWRFLFLILISTAVDFVAGLQMERRPQHARHWLVASVLTNLGILFSFKYFGFFIGSLRALLGSVGLEPGFGSLELVVPVGISFYTFQSMSYSIDVFRKKLAAQHDPLLFAVYVGFFPQLVAGPIERARRLFPQLATRRKVDLAAVQTAGNLILWGLVKKVILADNLARVVDPVFAAKAPDALAIGLAAYAFAFQIYFDFSGYTDIARGVARLMGFDLSLNFRQPYLSKGPREFWRRWHITLSRWLRDYLYIPLGGSRDGQGRTLRNLMLTMVLGGLWHGTAWHFVLWGFFHGLLLVAYRARPLAALSEAKGLGGLLAWMVFFHLCAWGWMMFRADEIGQFIWFSMRLFSGAGQGGSLVGAADVLMVALAAVVLFGSDLLARRREESQKTFIPAWAPQTLIFTCACLALILFGVYDGSPFIYFQF